ncbi:MAG: tRNA (adenosine(37)-N6)-threonylcarbamoyltransferase complex dimerization subunit type 1 TsaB [Chthoniobacterales bacterium]
MKVLAIETSSAHASVAVAREGELLAVRRFDAPRGRGAELFAVLQELRPHWHDADRLALGLGPGSYNGLRVACAVAGSCQLALGLDLVTAPSPCLLNVPEERYLAIGDARGSRFYVAEVERRTLRGDIALLDEAALAARVAAAPPIPVYRVGSVPGYDHLPDAAPDAAVLARLAPELSPTDPRKLEPLYLKPPHITTPRAART